MGEKQRSQIEMSDGEVQDFLEQSRTATMATIGPDGMPHLVAMWFGLIDGEVWFETKAKSQKVVNLRRDNRMTVMVEDGLTYDTLRGVALEGTADVVEDPDALWALGVNVWERYNGPYSDEVKPFVEVMLNKRVAVRLNVSRVRSWDHTKLGMPAMPVGGTTAPQAADVGASDGERVDHQLDVAQRIEDRARTAGCLVLGNLGAHLVGRPRCRDHLHDLIRHSLRRLDHLFVSCRPREHFGDIVEEFLRHPLAFMMCGCWPRYCVTGGGRCRAPPGGHDPRSTRRVGDDRCRRVIGPPSQHRSPGSRPLDGCTRARRDSSEPPRRRSRRWLHHLHSRGTDVDRHVFGSSLLVDIVEFDAIEMHEVAVHRHRLVVEQGTNGLNDLRITRIGLLRSTPTFAANGSHQAPGRR